MWTWEALYRPERAVCRPEGHFVDLKGPSFALINSRIGLKGPCVGLRGPSYGLPSKSFGPRGQSAGVGGPALL